MNSSCFFCTDKINEVWSIMKVTPKLVILTVL